MNTMSSGVLRKNGMFLTEVSRLEDDDFEWSTRGRVVSK